MLSRIARLAALALAGVLLRKKIASSRGGQSGSSSSETIVVSVPVRVAYDQFAQFEGFPRFMDSVHELRQLDARRLHWRGSVAGKDTEWDAEITEQVADSRIAWRSTSGVPNGGTVTFRSLSRARTRITLDLYDEPQDGVERAAGALRQQARANLKQFKEMIELRGQDTGAWRATFAAQPGPRGSTIC